LASFWVSYQSVGLLRWTDNYVFRVKIQNRQRPHLSTSVFTGQDGSCRGKSTVPIAPHSQGSEAASVPYAVIGGNAVAAWVSRIDEAAVCNTQDVDILLRDAVHVLMAGQKVRPEYETPAPDVMDSERGEEFQVVSLQALIEMKLNSFRDKDRTHSRDMLEIGLIDET